MSLLVLRSLVLRSEALLRRVVISAFFILHYLGVQVCRILFVVVEARIETGGWTPEPRVSRASIDTSIDNLKRKSRTESVKGAGDHHPTRRGSAWPGQPRQVQFDQGKNIDYNNAISEPYRRLQKK